MQLEVKNIKGTKAGDIELDDAVFGADVHEHLLWETVKWQLAKRRRGTHATRLRGEVRGHHAKPYKQKGTGRARQGSTKSAQHVGGGVVFGPQPRSYEYTMPRKARRKALRAALSLRVKENRLIVLDSFPVEDGKTKAVTAALAALGVSQPTTKVLIVEESTNQELVRGARNLRSSKWLAPEGLNVYDVLNHEALVITSAMAKQLEAALRP
jgi:large subunit ribosomal protein L4